MWALNTTKFTREGWSARALRHSPNSDGNKSPFRWVNTSFEETYVRLSQNISANPHGALACACAWSKISERDHCAIASETQSTVCREIQSLSDPVCSSLRVNIHVGIVCVKNACIFHEETNKYCGWMQRQTDSWLIMFIEELPNVVEHAVPLAPGTKRFCQLLKSEKLVVPPVQYKLPTQRHQKIIDCHTFHNKKSTVESRS